MSHQIEFNKKVKEIIDLTLSFTNNGDTVLTEEQAKEIKRKLLDDKLTELLRLLEEDEKNNQASK